MRRLTARGMRCRSYNRDVTRLKNPGCYCIHVVVVVVIVIVDVVVLLSILIFVLDVCLG